jgi:hypothetical protein
MPRLVKVFGDSFYRAKRGGQTTKQSKKQKHRVRRQIGRTISYGGN